MSRGRILKAVCGSLLAVILLYVGGCSIKTARLQRQFDSVSVGDAADQVIKVFGAADVKETKGAPFFRYSSNRCVDPCDVRLWYENRMTLDIEAWSFDIDRNGRVAHKYHWVSP
jgi:hypothetical protein